MRRAPHRKGKEGQNEGRSGRRPPAPAALDLVVMRGCFASGLAVTIDVLATANVLASALGSAPPFRHRVLSSDGAPVTTSAGAQISVDGPASEVAAPHVLVFGPGMASVERIGHDVRRSDAQALYPVLRAARSRGALLAASCSSTFLLAEAGVLDGERATTSWWLGPTFRARYPAVSYVDNAMVVASGEIVTAGAAMAQLDLALHLVRRLAGAELAEACARYLIVDDARPSQGPYLVVDHLARNDPLVMRAEAILRADLARPFVLSELAARVGASPRTLTRRFEAATALTPARFLRRLRIEAAAHRLATSHDGIEQVAGATGYDDERAFRRAFTRELGVSPARYRATRRGRDAV